LDNASGKFNWCVYGSDAPPKVTAANGTYTLYGTPPFTLIAAGGTATQTVAATSIATSAVTITPVTLTDETGCPGVFCIYTGSDLFIDATHLCQIRASGAQNWEAWIKDTRDNELYRIVLMPDSKWWLAQNVRYAKTGSSVTINTCTAEKCGRWYTKAEILKATNPSGETGNTVQGVCPNGWVMPNYSDWTTFVGAIPTADYTVAAQLRAPNAGCSPMPDTYGWADPILIDRKAYANSPCKMMIDDDYETFWWDINQSSVRSCNTIRYTVAANFACVARCIRL
jgi:uncharacterized protein (TIGR02145 family)